MMRKYRLWKSSSKFLWLMLCIFLFSISVAYASNEGADGGNTWTRVNIGLVDLTVKDLFINPLNPTAIYAATWDGIFKSINGGESWMNIGLSGLEVRNFFTIDFTVVTAGTSGGTYMSTDGGGSWTKINDTPFPRSFHSPVYVIDPIAPTTAYMGTRHRGVRRSTDGENTWTEVNTGFTGMLRIYSLAMDPITPTTLYAGTYQDGVFKTTNGGDSWTQVNNGLTDLTIYTLAIDPITPTTLYAGTWDGIFKTTNGGKSWMNIGLTDLEVIKIVIDPLNPTTIYTVTDGGVFKLSVE